MTMRRYRAKAQQAPATGRTPSACGQASSEAMGHFHHYDPTRPTGENNADVAYLEALQQSQPNFSCKLNPHHSSIQNPSKPS